MKKILRNSSVLILSIIVFGLSFFYLKFLDSDYNSLIKQAYKRRDEFPQFVVFDGEYEPAIPDEEKNLKGHLGLDSDHNGIRDDIDIWIDRTGFSFNERMAMKQYAKALQVLLGNCDALKSSQTLVDLESLSKSRVCLRVISDYERGGKFDSVDMLNKLILNTKLRKACHKDDFINGIEIMASIELMKMNCHFEVQDPKGIIEVFKILRATKH